MKRVFLSSLGFCKGAIDAVMNEHGREIGEHVRRQKRLQRRILKLEKRLYEFKQLKELNGRAQKG